MAESQPILHQQTVDLSSPNNLTPQPAKNNLKITLLLAATLIILIIVSVIGVTWYTQRNKAQTTNSINAPTQANIQNNQVSKANNGFWNQVTQILGNNPTTAPSSTDNKTSQQNNQIQKGDFILSDSVVQLPFSINDTRVFRAAISYSFIGEFFEFRTSPQGREIVLKDAGDLPKFIIEEDRTRFYWWDDAKKLSAYAKESDFKPGNKTRINTFYSLKQRHWTTHQVFIYVDAIPEGAIATAITE